jgi:hypothetical protein
VSASGVKSDSVPTPNGGLLKRTLNIKRRETLEKGPRRPPGLSSFYRARISPYFFSLSLLFFFFFLWKNTI